MKKTQKTSCLPILRQIAQLGHPVLRKSAKPIEDIQEEKIQELIDDLIVTMKESDGVGIAAPQVYQSLRLFIINTQPDSPRIKPLAVINPLIHTVSEDVVDGWEGCLSVPGIRGIVSRPVSATVEYTTREGKIVKKTLKDFVARIFLHEYDHLDGIVFLDRVEDTRDLMSEKEYQKMITKESLKVEKSKSRKESTKV